MAGLVIPELIRHFSELIRAGKPGTDAHKSEGSVDLGRDELAAHRTLSAVSHGALPPSRDVTVHDGPQQRTFDIVAMVAALSVWWRRPPSSCSGGTASRERGWATDRRPIPASVPPSPRATSSSRPHRTTTSTSSLRVHRQRSTRPVPDVLSSGRQLGQASASSGCRASVAQPLDPALRVTHPSCSGGSPESRSIPSVMASRLKSRRGSLIS